MGPAEEDAKVDLAAAAIAGAERRSLSIRDISSLVQVLPKWAPQTICEVFLRKVEQQLKSYNAPPHDWPRVLALLFDHDINAQEWVQEHVVDPEGLSWEDRKALISRHFEAADYHETLKKKYQICRQGQQETAQSFGDRFQHLCAQLGYSDDNEVVINHFLDHLQPRMHADFLKFKVDREMAIGHWLAHKFITRGYKYLHKA